MIRSLVIKEFWDLRGVIAFGVVIHALLLANLLGMPSYEWLPMREAQELPFTNSFPLYLAVYTIFFAGLMGVVQALSDARGQRWLFVLPMPVRTENWMLGKLVFGLGVWALLGVGTYLLGILIVSTPGVFPAPFEWWMTRTGWTYLAMAPFVYLAGFLSGIRPGSWFGTRLLPLLGSLALIGIFIETKDFLQTNAGAFLRSYIWIFYSAFLLSAYGVVIYAILRESQEKDYP